MRNYTQNETHRRWMDDGGESLQMFLIFWYEKKIHFLSRLDVYKSIQIDRTLCNRLAFRDTLPIFYLRTISCRLWRYLRLSFSAFQRTLFQFEILSQFACLLYFISALPFDICIRFQSNTTAHLYEKSCWDGRFEPFFFLTGVSSRDRLSHKHKQIAYFVWIFFLWQMTKKIKCKRMRERKKKRLHTVTLVSVVAKFSFHSFHFHVEHSLRRAFTKKAVSIRIWFHLNLDFYLCKQYQFQGSAVSFAHPLAFSVQLITGSFVFVIVFGHNWDFSHIFFFYNFLFFLLRTAPSWLRRFRWATLFFVAYLLIFTRSSHTRTHTQPFIFALTIRNIFFLRTTHFRETCQSLSLIIINSVSNTVPCRNLNRFTC